MNASSFEHLALAERINEPLPAEAIERADHYGTGFPVMSGIPAEAFEWDEGSAWRLVSTAPSKKPERRSRPSTCHWQTAY